ncbi:MAG TPA: glycosyltransferase [Paralcaligenes sp.]
MEPGKQGSGAKVENVDATCQDFKDMKKILYIGGFESDEKGAIGTHTAGILRALDESDFFDLHLTNISSAKPHYLPRNLHEYYLPKPANKIAKIFAILKYALYVKKIIKKIRPDFIYLRFDPFLTPLLTVRKTKSLVEYNDIFLDQILFTSKKKYWGYWGTKFRNSGIYKRIIRSSERYTFARAHMVIAVTDGILKYCINIKPDANGIVLHNASNAFCDITAPSQNEALILSHVGTLTYWDGLEELIEAINFALVKAPETRIRLNIVGDGPLQPRLKGIVHSYRLENVVRFYSSVTHDQALNFVQSSDVIPLLKTIYTYGLSPIKYYEAMASGCHILVSDIPCINEATEYVGTVVSYPLKIKEIGDKIIELSQKKEDIRKNRKRIQAYAFENHTWDSRVQLLKEKILFLEAAHS